MPVKSKVEILQNFVAFSEYTNFIQILWLFAFFLNMVMVITLLHFVISTKEKGLQ